MTLLQRLFLGLALAGATACSSTGRKLDAAEVPAALEAARADLTAGRNEDALDRMRAAANATGLPTAQRDAVQRTLEEAAALRIEELSRPGSDPDDLADLVDLELPRQLAVLAGLRAARGLFDEGEAYDAYKLLKKLDAKYPEHHERFAAGELLVEIGLWLVPNGTGWLGIGHSTGDAQEVLEYVLIHHPSAPRCAEAYVALAQVYEDDRDWQLARERYELLVLNHPNSPLRRDAQARIPNLRLRALRSPEYDRSELLRAKSELETWLADFAGQEGEREVRVDLGDCLRRLVDNDLAIARFYRTVGNAYGQRYHAERAVQEARTAGDEDRAQERDRG
ncbi:MAG: hypothetical protein IPJ77_01455 [Planctomycetes bacterium]|nr:hypothetical protein [Planctomycetota bacterium]